MPIFDHMEQLEDVDFSRSHLWNIRFPGLETPAQFRDWLPATSISRGYSPIEYYEIPAYMKSYSVPHMLGSSSLSVTFTDTVDYAIFDWIYEWRRFIANKKRGIRTLSEVSRKLVYYRLDNDLSLIKKIEHDVIVKGALQEDSGSEDVPRNYPIEFKVL